MQKLVNYLKQLNSADASWGIWLNLGNFDEFRIGQKQFENGGLLDDWEYIGSLDTLSFGYQSDSEAFEAVLGVKIGRSQSQTSTNWGPEGRAICINPDSLYDAFQKGKVAPVFAQWLRGQMSLVQGSWAEEEAKFFVSQTLPERFGRSLSAVAV